MHLVRVMLQKWNAMIRSICFLLLLILTSCFSDITAQQNDSLEHTTSVSNAYQTETIYLRFSTFEKNKELYEIGIFGEGLKQEMSISPDAMAVFKKYQKQKRWSAVCAGLQLVTQIAAFTTRDKSQRTGLHIGGAGISIVAVPLFIGSTKNLNKAVWIRNGEVLK